MDVKEAILEYQRGNLDIKVIMKILKPMIDRGRDKYQELGISDEVLEDITCDLIDDYDVIMDFVYYFRANLDSRLKKILNKKNGQLVRDYLDTEFTFTGVNREELFLEFRKLFRYLGANDIKIDKVVFNAIWHNDKVRELIDSLFLSDKEAFKGLASDISYERDFIIFILTASNIKKNSKDYQNAELVRRYQMGEEELLEEIIKRNIGLVQTSVNQIILNDKREF